MVQAAPTWQAQDTELTRKREGKGLGVGVRVKMDIFVTGGKHKSDDTLFQL